MNNQKKQLPASSRLNIKLKNPKCLYIKRLGF